MSREQLLAAEEKTVGIKPKPSVFNIHGAYLIVRRFRFRNGDFTNVILDPTIYAHYDDAQDELERRSEIMHSAFGDLSWSKALEILGLSQVYDTILSLGVAPSSSGGASPASQR